jgi:hypothetical protein
LKSSFDYIPHYRELIFTMYNILLFLQAEKKEEELKEWLEKRRAQRAEAKRVKEVSEGI